MEASQDEEEVLLAVEESLARKTVGMLRLKDEESSSDLDQRNTTAEARRTDRNSDNPGNTYCNFPASPSCLFTMPSRHKGNLYHSREQQHPR